jgi:site-specific recombinase XerD
MQLLNDLLPQYERFLAGKKRSQRGIERYRYALKRYFHYLGPEATLEQITQATIEEYQESIAHLSGSTIGNALSCIRSFCRWAIRRGFRLDDPTIFIERPSKKRPAPRALRTEELQALMAAIKEPDDLSQEEQWYWQRNRRAVLLMLYAGLRLAEAAALRWKDVDLLGSPPYLVVRDGKGGHDRIVPLHRRLLRELKMVPTDERQTESAVAGKTDGGNLSYRSIEHVCDRWLANLGVDISAHQLRHTFATQMLINGANLRAIQVAMGHKDLSTTERYLMVDTTETKKAIDVIPDDW